MGSSRQVALGFVVVVVVLALSGADSGWAGGDMKPDALRSSSWWMEVESNLREEQYRITWDEEQGAFCALNRRSNLRMCFRETGIEVLPGTGDAGWHWEFGLKGFGRVEKLTPMGKASPVAEGRRVEYVRNGVTEWYENREEGIEQGFTIAERPEGEGPLVLEGNILANLDARLAADERSVSFTRGGVEVLRYGELVVKDADGQTLRSRLSLQGNRLAILIEGDGRYPIYIDPLITTPSWIVESDQAGAAFGVSIACAGDVNNDGYSDVIVGACEYDDWMDGEGCVFGYYGGASGLATTPSWSVQINQTGAKFGYSVASAGDVNDDGYSDVIIGAPYFDTLKYNIGRAYIYLGSPAGLDTVPSFLSGSDQSWAYFGRSVACAGDVNNDGYSDVIVGEDGYDNGESNEGRAFVFLGGASGVAETPVWTAESDLANCWYAWSVSCAGDVNNDGYSDVIVGAPYVSGGELYEGRAYVYHGSASGPAASASWQGECDQSDANLGWSVACAGDVNNDGYSDVIAGAPGEYQYRMGHAYIFHGSASGLSGTYAWVGSDPEDANYFGRSVACAGDINEDDYDDVIVGARNYSNVENTAGSAHIFYGGSTGTDSLPAWTVICDQVQASFGVSVASAGDVNRDDCPDVIVGASQYTNGQDDEGRAYSYYGIPGPECEVSPTTLDFGSVVIGGYQDRLFSIGNTGGDTLRGTVSEDCDYYSIISGGGPYELAGGQSVTATVRFEPDSIGTHECTVETGCALCSDVFCTGTGELPPPVHDVALTGVVPAAADVIHGFPLSIDVTVENQGNRPESTEVVLYAEGVFHDAFDRLDENTWGYYNPAAAEGYASVSGGMLHVSGYSYPYQDGGLTTIQEFGLPVTIETKLRPMSSSSFSPTVKYAIPWEDGYVGFYYDATPGYYWNLGFLDSAGFHNVSCGGSLSLGTWYTVKLVIDETTIDAYLNGDLLTSPSWFAPEECSKGVSLTSSYGSTGGGDFDWVKVHSMCAIDTVFISNLEPGQDTTLTVVWNTLTVPPGEYQLSAHASEVVGETDTADNTYLDGTIEVVPACTLFVSTTAGGTVDPAPGPHVYACSSWVLVAAIPDTLDSFDHWVLDGEDMGGSNPDSVFMDDDHTLYPVFTMASVEVDVTRPDRFLLGQPYPNPSSAVVTVRYEIPRESEVAMRVYDVSGRTVRTLCDRALAPGRYMATWDGYNESGQPVAPGVYCFRLEAAGSELTRRVVLLR